MKKIKLIALPLVAALGLGAVACTPQEVDEAPEITGVADKMCAVGELYDLLDGIAALDKEDGDITPSLEITIDGEKADGFYTTFDTEYDYEVNYKVTDSKGNVAEETAIISALSRDVYKSFDLARLDGFEVKTSGGAKCSQSIVGDGDNLPLTLKTSGAKADGDVVLSREYTLKTGAEYTFKYYVKSNVAGKAKAKVGGGDAVDLTVAEGDNVLTFTYSVPENADKEEVKADVQVQLGGLGDAQIDFVKAEAEHFDNAGYHELIGEDFIFPKIENRDNHAKEVGLTDGGKSVFVKTNGTYAIYQEGVFINTGITLAATNDYKVSFDLETENDGPFEVCIQRSQWGPNEFLKTIYDGDLNKHGTNVVELNDVPADKDNTLWLFIQSGTNANTISLSNLSVQYKPKDGNVVETFHCGHAFKMFAKQGAPNYVQWVDGKLVFEVEKFSDTDWHNKIEGPQFYLDTAGIDFRISFKARATAPVLVTWVGPKSGGWDPNLIWQQFNLSDEEKVYTFKGNESDSSLHQFEWQFGFSVNKKYENVKIEISDIVIYWPNGVLDS